MCTTQVHKADWIVHVVQWTIYLAIFIIGHIPLYPAAESNLRKSYF